MTNFLKNNSRVLWGIFALFLIIGLNVISPASLKAQTPGEAVNASIDYLDSTAGQAKIIPMNDQGKPLLGGVSNISTIIGNVINIGLAIFTIVFFILIIYGGVIWLTAGGDSAKADKARTTLTNAVLGIIVIIIAYLLTNFILFRIIGITTTLP